MNLLAQQMSIAKANGMGVILTMNQFPPWLNNLTWEDQGGFQQVSKHGHIKSPAQRIPDDVSTTSQWAYLVAVLLSCFSAGSARTSIDPAWRNGWTDVLEIANEPNDLCWPQSDSNRSRWAGCQVGKMMQTAIVVNSWFGTQTAIGGPGITDGAIPTSDGLTATSTPTWITGTDAQWFASDFIAVFSGSSTPPGGRAIFTMHNYGDVSTIPSSMAVASLRERQLRGRWAGYPNADVNDPHIWITEGGVRLDTTLSNLGSYAAALAAQSTMVYSAFTRMKNNSTDRANGGAGIDMTTHYLFETDPSFDSGLVEQSHAGRPAFTTWGGL